MEEWIYGIKEMRNRGFMELWKKNKDEKNIYINESEKS